jgi:hypothetical protein
VLVRLGAPDVPECETPGAGRWGGPARLACRVTGRGLDLMTCVCIGLARSVNLSPVCVRMA